MLVKSGLHLSESSKEYILEVNEVKSNFLLYYIIIVLGISRNTEVEALGG